jgi:hypothetical protein
VKFGIAPPSPGIFCHAAVRHRKAGFTAAGGAHAKDRYLKGMAALLRRLPGAVRWSLGALVATALGLLPESPAVAFDLFATHEVTVQFATADGKPMANAEVTVFAPGDLKTPVETGHTDLAGKFVFGTDRDGLWSAQARTKGEVARVMIRVGGPHQQQQRGRISPVVVIGGLLALLALAIWYRVLRRRNQRPQP